MATSGAAEIREQLGHPVVDCDGHWQESLPVFLDYLRDTAGTSLADQFAAARRAGGWSDLTPEQRMHQRLRRPDVQWPVPAETEDLATAMLPGLMAERLGELGIDFAIVYPTLGLGLSGLPDAEMRAQACRAYNRMAAEVFEPHRQRLTPAAVIPLTTPEEALAELDYAVRTLHLKVMMVRGATQRPVPAHAQGAAGAPYYMDSLGLDSPYDYDPLWRRCVELGVAITSHGGSRTWADRASVNNFTYNHIGHFAQANHVFAKGIFLGGVTRRFPLLNFIFLEGGAGYAVNLLHDLIGHWEKLNVASVRAFRSPHLTDRARLRELIERHGSPMMRARRDEMIASLPQPEAIVLDDFQYLGDTTPVEMADLFSRRFYFGCEADDPVTAWAFDARMGARVKAVFSSDISHWDVQSMAEVLPEAFEMVEKGWLSESDFRDFTFAHAVHLHGEMNPRFFDGTTVERAARAELGPATSAQGGLSGHSSA